MDELCNRLKDYKEEDLEIEIEDDGKLDCQTLEENQKEIIRRLKNDDDFTSTKKEVKMQIKNR